MSLTTCLKQATALTAADRKQILADVRAFKRDGMDQAEAARAAVGNLLKTAEAELTQAEQAARTAPQTAGKAADAATKSAAAETTDTKAETTDAKPEMTAMPRSQMRLFEREAEAYGGRGAYDRAVEAGRTKLTFPQWVTVRTPQFKAWFGDWEVAGLLRTEPVAKLTGQEVSSLQRGQPDFIRKLRADAQTWSNKNIVGQFTNARSGLEIEIRRGGIKNTLAHNAAEQKVKAMAAIPDVLQRGFVVFDGVNPKNEAQRFVAVSAVVQIAGQDFVVTAGATEDQNGRLFYDHELMSVERADELSSKSGVAGKGNSPVLAAQMNDMPLEAIRQSADGLSKAVDPNTGEPLASAIDDFNAQNPAVVREDGPDYAAAPAAQPGQNALFPNESLPLPGSVSKLTQATPPGVATSPVPEAGGRAKGVQRVPLADPRRRKYVLPKFGRAQEAVELMQNRYNRMQQTLEAVRAQGGRITEANDWYRTEERMHGQMATLADAMQADMGALMQGLADDNLDIKQLQMFSYAMHAKERNDSLRRMREKSPVNGFDSWSGMEDDKARTIIAEAKKDGTYANLLKHQKTLQTWIQGTRDLMLDEGLITPSEYQVLVNAYNNYVPLRGRPDDPFAEPGQEDEPRRIGKGQGLDIRGKEWEEARGRYTEADSIIENIIADRLGAINRAGKNRVLRSFLQFVEDNPSMNLWEVQSIANKPVFTKDTRGDQKIVEEVALEKDADTISVKDGGVEVYIKIRDKRLLAQFKHMNVEAATGYIGWLLSANRTLASLYTTLNPVFTVLNGARDVAAATIGMIDTQGFAGAGRFAMNLPRAMAEAYRAERGRPSAEYQLFLATGGTTGFQGFRDLDGLTEALQKELANANRPWFNPMQLGSKALAILEGANSIVENTTRFAAFQAAYQGGKGVSLAKAATISKNITVNFNRKGTQNAASAWFLFFNPAVQGTARIAQALGNKKVLATLGMAMTGSALLALQNASMGDDEDGEAWWDKIPDEVKDRNLVIVLPPGIKGGEAVPNSKTGRYLKIPLPYGWNLFHTMAQQSVDTWRNSQDAGRGRKPVDAAVLTARSAVTGFMPMGEIGAAPSTGWKSLAMAATPDAFNPIMQPILNLNAFGKPMFPEPRAGEKGTPDSSLYFAGQAGTMFQKTAAGLNSVTGGDGYQAGWIDLAPATIEGLVRGYGGGPASFTLDMLNAVYARQSIKREDVDVRRLPFIKQTYGVIDNETDRAASFASMDKLDELADPIQRAKSDAKAGSEAAAEAYERMVNEGGSLLAVAKLKESIDKSMSKIRKAELQVISDKNLSDSAKFAQIQAFGQQKRQLLAEFNKSFNQALREQAGEDTNADRPDPATRFGPARAGAAAVTSVTRAVGF
jgi:hypothetical protein